jgi:hypothetical protein
MSSLLGYAIYIGVIFLPGIGLGEFLDLWRDGDSLLEELAVALGLGLSIDTLAFLIRTSGISLFGVALRGIDPTTSYLLIALGLFLVLLAFAKNKKLHLAKKPKLVDLGLLIIMAVQGFLIIFYFEKYPIFPEYQSQDFLIHSQTVQNLISGAITSIPQGILYYGVHYQLAAAQLLIGGSLIADIRYTMAILVVLSALVFYLGAKRILSSSLAAFVATLIYSLSGTIWFVSVFNSGLYPNFYGIMSALFLFVVLATMVSGLSWQKWIVFLLASINLFMSHYTALTIIPVVILLPVISAVQHKPEAKKIAYPAIFLTAVIGVPLLIDPALTNYVLFLASQGGGSIVGSTTLSNSLSGFPVLGYMAAEVFDDVAFALILITAFLYIYRVARLKTTFLFVPLIWFLALIAAAPFNVSAWRFSFEALVPLTFMSGFGITMLLPNFESWSRTRAARRGQKQIITKTQSSPSLWRIFLVVLIFAGILAGSWSEMMLVDSQTNTTLSSQTQTQVYSALLWMEDNTPRNSSYLTLTDWRFAYSIALFNRPSYYQFASTPDQAIPIARNLSAQYIIITSVVTLKLPPAASLYPWNNFPGPGQSLQSLLLVYNSSDVRIYKIVFHS